MVRAHCGVKAPSESRAVGALMEHPMETDSMETHTTSMEVSLLEGFMESVIFSHGSRFHFHGSVFRIHGVRCE